MPRLPLEGIRVLDSTYVFALPYTGGQLADLGAEVIKVEGPGRPDITRTGGLYGTFPDNELGEEWWDRPSTYNLLNRGKRSLTLDMSTERGRDLFRQLVAVSDVVMENFTPRVMRGWGLDYPNLRKIKPDIILVSNTGYGHGDGPYSGYPAQATTQEGTHGHCWVTGYQDDEPSKAGRSFVDFLSTWTAVFAIGGALRYRNLTGKGQWVDIGMYQAGVMFLSEYIMDAIANGREGERIGNRHPYFAPQGCYPCRGEDQWVVLSVADDHQWESLCRVMGRQDLLESGRFAGILSRRRGHDEIDEIISEWTRGLDRYEAMHALQENGDRRRAGVQQPGRTLRPPLQGAQLPGAGGVRAGAEDGYAAHHGAAVQVLQHPHAHPVARAPVRRGKRAFPQGCAGSGAIRLRRSGGRRRHRLRPDLRRACPDAAPGGIGGPGAAGRLGPGLPGAAWPFLTPFPGRD